jgi:hypothetical protein
MSADGVSGVATLGQVMRKRVNVGRQLALAKAIGQPAVKVSSRVHYGLVKWDCYFRTPRKLCPVHPQPTSPATQRTRCPRREHLRAVHSSGLCIGAASDHRDLIKNEELLTRRVDRRRPPILTTALPHRVTRQYGSLRLLLGQSWTAPALLSVKHGERP